MTDLSRCGTLGRVYGGDPDLIHAKDGTRAAHGEAIADAIDERLRHYAENRTDAERASQLVCPGCYMVVGFNALTELARRNGQPMRELALSMAAAFQALADGGPDRIEEITVLSQPEPDEDGWFVVDPAVGYPGGPDGPRASARGRK